MDNMQRNEVSTEKDDLQVENSDLEPLPELLFCEICGTEYMSGLLLIEHMKDHMKEPSGSHEDNEPAPVNITENSQSIGNRVSDHTSTLAAVAVSKDLIRRETVLYTTAPLPKTRKSCATRTLFACVECRKTFRRRHNLRYHMRIHAGEKSYICRNCGESFTHSGTLYRHMKVHQKQKAYVCKEWKRLFLQSHRLKIPMKIRTREKPWDLRKIQKSHTGEGLESNENRETGCVRLDLNQNLISTKTVIHDMPSVTRTKRPRHTRRFACEECGKKFLQRNHLQAHSRIHTGEKPYFCSKCSKSFSQLGSLHTHMRQHEGRVAGRRFECEECGKRFSQRIHLQVHSRIHSGEKPYICSNCGKSFAQQSNRNRHLRCHERERSYSCRECNKLFFRLCDFKIHERMHTGAKQYVCGECGKVFISSRTLRRHQKLHDGEKLKSIEDPKPVSMKKLGQTPLVISHDSRKATDVMPKKLSVTLTKLSPYAERCFVCDVCGKTFLQRRHLQTHSVIHTVATPDIFSNCGKSFTQQSSLFTHIGQIHNKKKSYVCKECNSSFLRIRDLKIHGKIHAGRKPYVCKKCGKAFSESSDLRRHQYSHPGEMLGSTRNRRIRRISQDATRIKTKMQKLSTVTRKSESCGAQRVANRVRTITRQQNQFPLSTGSDM